MDLNQAVVGFLSDNHFKIFSKNKILQKALKEKEGGPEETKEDKEGSSGEKEGRPKKRRGGRETKLEGLPLEEETTVPKEAE
jgi:hypothetical protein